MPSSFIKPTIVARARSAIPGSRLCQRSFSVSASYALQLQIHRQRKVESRRKKYVQPFQPAPVERLDPPEYPYGANLTFKRSNKGLYGGREVQTGNNVSRKTKTKTRRTWLPNIQRKRLWSDALHQFIQIKVSTRVLRTMEKVGGLDEYLIGSDKPARIKELGLMGWRLRWVIMNTKRVRRRMAREARELGIDDKTRFERGWMNSKELQAYLPIHYGVTEQEAKEISEEDNGLAIDGKDVIGDAIARGDIAETSVIEDSLDAQDAKDAAAEEAENPREAAAEAAAAAEQTLQNKGKVDWVATERLHREQQVKAYGRILKLHNLKGRAAKRTPKYEFTVLRKKLKAEMKEERIEYIERKRKEKERERGFQNRHTHAEPSPAQNVAAAVGYGHSEVVPPSELPSQSSEAQSSDEFIQPSKRPWWKLWASG